MTDIADATGFGVADRNPSRPSTNHSLSRFALVAAPASAVTFALFGVMSALIATEYTPTEAGETREISTIIPEIDTDGTVDPRPRVQPIQAAEAPPPQPEYSIRKINVVLPTPVIAGGVPISDGFQTVDKIVFSPVAIADRPLQAIRPPLPTYPARALNDGIEGECAVQLDVDARGRPFNVEAICTDSVFERAAVRAVEKAKFVPEVASGQPIERRNVVYPLNFTLAD